MKIKVLAFGIAKDILQKGETEWEVSPSTSLADLKTELTSQYPDFQKLASLKLAVNEDYQTDDYIIQENDEVVIIPPVSGG